MLLWRCLIVSHADTQTNYWTNPTFLMHSCIMYLSPIIIFPQHIPSHHLTSPVHVFLNSGFGSVLAKPCGDESHSSEPQALRLSKALWGWISLVQNHKRCAWAKPCGDESTLVQNHKCCAQLCLYKLVVPEREVAVCFADEGQQAINGESYVDCVCPLTITLTVWNYAWVTGVQTKISPTGQ